MDQNLQEKETSTFQTTCTAAIFGRIQVFLLKVTFKMTYLCDKIYMSILKFNRAELRPQDLWTKLSRNWTFFFWLTGEIPPTLQVMIDLIQHEYIPHVQRGRPQSSQFYFNIGHLEWVSFPKFVNLYIFYTGTFNYDMALQICNSISPVSTLQYSC